MIGSSVVERSPNMISEKMEADRIFFHLKNNTSNHEKNEQQNMFIT